MPTTDSHPHIAHFLRLAYCCMACDGHIADSEVACLRSIAVQLGQPVEEVDRVLDEIASRFANEGGEMAAAARSVVVADGLDHQGAVLLVDMLVQLVEADGTVQGSEARFVRDLVADLDMDRSRLAGEFPEWRPYLAGGLKEVAEAGRPTAAERLKEGEISAAMMEVASQTARKEQAD